ncbi:MAG: hypothetical protein OEO23_06970, partial [Gemmatimonadota bacterium]|nr:hypothetical protein [Gemmatimonadota bacterium]
VAESAVEHILETHAGPPPASVGSGALGFATGALGGRDWSVTLARPDLEFMGLFGGAALSGGGEWIRVGRAVWWLSPGARVASFTATLEVGDGPASSIPPGTLAGTPDALSTVGAHPECHGVPGLDEGALPLDSLGPLPPPPDWGEPQSWGTGSSVRLGLLDLSQLREMADVRLGDTPLFDDCSTCWVGLATVEGGGVISGRGAGVLVGEGALFLGPGVDWNGTVLVAGDLVLDSAAVVTGLVRVGGRVALHPEARVTPSGCAAYRSLVHAPGIHRPVRVGPSSYLGPISPG